MALSIRQAGAWGLVVGAMLAAGSPALAQYEARPAEATPGRPSAPHSGPLLAVSRRDASPAAVLTLAGIQLVWLIAGGIAGSSPRREQRARVAYSVMTLSAVGVFILCTHTDPLPDYGSPQQRALIASALYLALSYIMFRSSFEQTFPSAERRQVGPPQAGGSPAACADDSPAGRGGTAEVGAAPQISDVWAEIGQQHYADRYVHPRPVEVTWRWAPVFGKLTWDPLNSRWTGRVTIAGSTAVLVVGSPYLKPTPDDQAEVISRACLTYRLLVEARTPLVPLEDEYPLAAAAEVIRCAAGPAGCPDPNLLAVARSLTIDTVRLGGGGELDYRAGDRFPGYRVSVFFDEAMRLRRIEARR